MQPALPQYEVYALRYATRDAQRRDHFIGGDPHDGPMPMDYYTWVAIGPAGAFVIDTGFTAEMAKARKREFLRCPVDSLKLLGVDAGTVRDVVLTHMHYDHVGNFENFPRATFHLQDREMAYATGRYMCHGRLRAPFDVENVTGLVRALYRGRVAFHDGFEQLDSGLSVHLVGGHSHGLQIVRVHTARGWVVIASDAAHFYAHMETGNPFPIVLNVGEMLEGHRTCHRLADSARHVVPGHDPLVLRRYPAPSPEVEGIVARLDAMPAE
jgi:glyoxylase-like metal-dependent hydrolase (beta-lactamase superfamily II)